MEKKNNEDTQN